MCVNFLHTAKKVMKYDELHVFTLRNETIQKKQLICITLDFERPVSSRNDRTYSAVHEWRLATYCCGERPYITLCGNDNDVQCETEMAA